MSQHTDNHTSTDSEGDHDDAGLEPGRPAEPEDDTPLSFEELQRRFTRSANPSIATRETESRRARTHSHGTTPRPDEHLPTSQHSSNDIESEEDGLLRPLQSQNEPARSAEPSIASGENTSVHSSLFTESMFAETPQRLPASQHDSDASTTDTPKVAPTGQQPSHTSTISANQQPQSPPAVNPVQNRVIQNIASAIAMRTRLGHDEIADALRSLLLAWLDEDEIDKAVGHFHQTDHNESVRSMLLLGEIMLQLENPEPRNRAIEIFETMHEFDIEDAKKRWD